MVIFVILGLAVLTAVADADVEFAPAGTALISGVFSAKGAGLDLDDGHRHTASLVPICGDTDRVVDSADDHRTGWGALREDDVGCKLGMDHSNGVRGHEESVYDFRFTKLWKPVGKIENVQRLFDIEDVFLRFVVERLLLQNRLGNEALLEAGVVSRGSDHQ